YETDKERERAREGEREREREKEREKEREREREGGSIEIETSMRWGVNWISGARAHAGSEQTVESVYWRMCDLSDTVGQKCVCTGVCVCVCVFVCVCACVFVCVS